MKRIGFRIVVAGLAAAFTQIGWSLGLGEISLYSYLNEPLSAELTLLETDGLDGADIRLGLASEQEFARLGVERTSLLDTVVFDVQPEGAAMRASLTTEQPLREPYLNFVVEARWPDGRLLREYTVLIDLPPRAMGEVSPASPELAPSVAVPQQNASLDTQQRSESGLYPGGSYLVRNSDTLWRIASAARPAGVTMEQAMLSIVRANPEAFDRENVNGLKSGYSLNLPAADAIVISPIQAKEEVTRQNAAWSDPSLEVVPGLKLVADPVPAPDQALPAEASSGAVQFSAADDVGGADQAVADPDASLLDVSSSANFDALLSKVEALERNLLRMEEQLIARDEELAALRAQLLAATVRSEQSRSDIASTTAGPIKTGLPDWVLLGGAGVLISGALAVWWSQRKRALAKFGDQEADVPSVQPAGSVETVPTSGRPDRQIQVADTLVPAEIDLADDRPDHSKEMLGVDAPSGTEMRPSEPASPGNEDADTFIEDDTPADSGLSLVPVHDAPEAASLSGRDEASPREPQVCEDSIYGVETDPVDSKLDLARAYLDMGDEEGARPVLAEVIREGNLAQQAEARELLLRLEV